MTNYSHPKCYARALCNCSKTISREHYVSESVISLLGDEHIISNASWLATGQKSNSLPTNAFASNILCNYHNSALSDLDTCAKSFFTEIRDVFLNSSESVPPRRVSIDGNALELWVLKTYCGAVASGVLTANGYSIKGEPPSQLLEILFSGVPIKKYAGLYISQAPLSPELGYILGPMDPEDLWEGGGFIFSGLELFILMDSITTKKQIMESSTNKISPLIYRPGAIRIESPIKTVEIELKWRNWSPKEWLSIRKQ